MDENEDEEIDEEMEEFEDNPIDFYHFNSGSEDNYDINQIYLFKKIEEKELKTNENKLYVKINNETKDISSYFIQSINEFHKLFNKNLKNFDDVLKYLESIPIPNKCVCAGAINNIPAWRCEDCSLYDSAIYCNDCYKKSKDLHKNHKLYYLYSSGGMCDCGDPDSLSTFCPDHTGPYKDQNEINEYITKSFSEEIINNLTKFFDEFFFKFSKYFILTDKCEYFYKNKFNEFLNDIMNDENDNNNDNLLNMQEDIQFLKNNCCIIFQNLLHFFRLICSKNVGMFNLISNYLLKNNFEKEGQKIDDEYKTTHSCIKIYENDIKILYNQENKNKNENTKMEIENEDNKQTNEDQSNNHICECNFLRLLLLNWREDINSKRKENEEFLLSFPRILPLKRAMCILLFFDYEKLILNNNRTLLSIKTQFFSEDITVLIAEKSTMIEDSFDIYFSYFSKQIKSIVIKNNFFNSDIIEKLYRLTSYKEDDIEYFSKPKIKELTGSKISIYKRIIDCICLTHNQSEFKSIFPHPQFQDNGFFEIFVDLDLKLLSIVEKLNFMLNWKNKTLIKEIFEYIINKILNQEKEGIKQLKQNEFSFHIGLYRCFGFLINCFCFNYSLENNCCIIDAINYFKNNFFKSPNDINIFANTILNVIFKLFGFIGGAKNGFFNYYGNTEIYYRYYFYIQELIKMDFTLLKYLFILIDGNISISYFFQISNIEFVYSTFEQVFLNKDNNKTNDNKIFANITNENINNENINNENINNENMNNENINNENINNENINNENINNENINKENIQNENIINNDDSEDVIDVNNAISNDDDVQNENNINENNQMMLIEPGLSNLDINNIINQWKFLLDLIIIFMKNDSSLYWSYIREYQNIISLKTKNDLFDNIRKNKYVMDDLENILKEQIIHIIIAQGNLTDLEKIKKELDDYLLTLFGEKKFNEILEELTLNKINNGKKMFYVKDSNFKYIDMNYYLSPKDKSNAQKYILDFKKDIIKSYNNYYFNPSQLTFIFYENIYAKILLNKDNLELIILILEKLLSITNSYSNEVNINSIKNIFLSSVLNYLSIFSCINTKSFIEFKNLNKISIDKINKILSLAIEQNINNKIIDNDLEEYIKDILIQLNRYEILYNNNLFLKEYNYNANNIELFKQNELNLNGNTLKETNIQNNNINDIKKLKLKNIKDKFKNKMKEKTKNFMDNANLNDKILSALNEQDKKDEKNKDTTDEIMCFFCRNNIKLNSFQVPYGKAGLLIEDFFYINSLKSTLKSELTKLNNNVFANNLYNLLITENDIDEDISKRIISCGHYFHRSCFKEHFQLFTRHLNCPLCLKKLNILIPPLVNFKKKYKFLKSETITQIFNKKTKIKNFEINKDSILFNDIIFDFMKNHISKDLKKEKIKDISDFDLVIEEILLNYKSYINFLENIFYVEGTHFNKIQQIYIIRNYILSLRYLMKNNYININQILNSIKTILNSLIKGPGKIEKIITNYENMHYINNFEKLLLLFSILFDYNELKTIFIYILNIFIPYFSFGFYLRSLILSNGFYSLYNNKLKQKISIKEIHQFFSKNNQYMIKNCFHYFLQKLLLIKIITDYDNINEDIINNFNNLTSERILSLIDINDLYKSLTKNKNVISFNTIFNEISKLFKNDDIFCKLYGNNFNYKIIFESLINNIKKNKDEKNLISKEFIVHFIPIKFEFINLDNNIFDFVEKNLEKKCDICSKKSKYYYLCIICGNKICHSKNNNDYKEHLKRCCKKYCLYIDMDNMNLILCSSANTKNLNAIYVNEAGVGPTSREIGNEFNLSNEKFKKILKNFICNDFNID